jgi:molecular chaperone GrpE (heat shock protein)
MRLTARSPKNNMAYLANVKPNEQVIESSYPDTLKCIMECFEKLAQYEETGLEPDTIEAQQQEIQQLQAENAAMREALEKSKTKFVQYRRVYGSIGAEAMTEVIDEALSAIEKAGGKSE